MAYKTKRKTKSKVRIGSYAQDFARGFSSHIRKK